jgi:hydroxylaminobenzene mutase
MTDQAGVRPLQRKTAAAGAVLLVLAFLTGILLAQAQSKKVDADVAEVVAAHLNALLGCLWLVAVAATLPWLRFGATGCKRLALITALAAYANWLVTTIKSFLHVPGIDLDGRKTNDVVFVALTVLVVIPSFVASIAWVYGLLGARSNDD